MNTQTPYISDHFMAFSGNIGGRKGILDGGPEPHENAVESVVFEDSEAQKENSAGRIRTYNQSVNSRLLYH